MFNDTFKYGEKYIDAAATLDEIKNHRETSVPQEARDALAVFEDSGAEFSFDPDYNYGTGIYDDPEQLPLVLIGTFGGYPGDSIDRANSRAAEEWAEDRGTVMAHAVWFGGCKMIELWYDLSNSMASAEDAQEAVDLAEGFMDYPVLDDDLWSELQMEDWIKMIDETIHDSEIDLDIDFTDEQKEQLREFAGEFMGYWDEGYFAEDEWNTIVEKVRTGDVQQHQDTKLI